MAAVSVAHPPRAACPGVQQLGWGVVRPFRPRLARSLLEKPRVNLAGRYQLPEATRPTRLHYNALHFPQDQKDRLVWDPSPMCRGLRTADQSVRVLKLRERDLLAILRVTWLPRRGELGGWRVLDEFHPFTLSVLNAFFSMVASNPGEKL